MLGNLWNRVKDMRTTVGGLSVSVVPIFDGIDSIVKGETLWGVLQLLSGVSGLLLGALSFSRK